MSPGPRIVFTRFISGDSPKLTPWIAHLRQVVAGAPTPVTDVDADEGAIVWQLVSANNRHLARSAAIHASFAEAETSARAIIAAAPTLDVEFVSQPSRGSYGWFVVDHAEPVMLCARWYVTPRDRRQSIELALRSLDEAEVHEGVRLVHHALKEGAPEPFLA